MPAPLSALGIDVDASRGEHPLPAPLPAGVRVLPAERVRQRHPSGTSGEIALVAVTRHGDDPRERIAQGSGQHGAPVPIAFPGTHDDLIAGKVDVLHPEPETLEQTQPAPVEQRHGEPLHPRGCAGAWP